MFQEITELLLDINVCVELLVGAFIARQEFNFELSLLDIICHPLNLYFHYRLQEIVGEYHICIFCLIVGLE